MKKKPAAGNTVPEWVVTYGDLMSLLLCFFILLVAFSEPKKPDAYAEIIEAIKTALGVPSGEEKDAKPGSPSKVSAEQIKELLSQAAGSDGTGTQDDNNVTGQHDRVSIVHDGNWYAVGGSLPFEAGSATLGLSEQRMLREEVAPRIRDRRNIVRVVGHSWGFQDTTAGSYLELSFARARAVHDFLVEECAVDPAVLRIVAAGNTEPAVASLDAASGAGAESRRVQVFMVDSTVDQMHPDPDGTGRGIGG